MQHIPLHFQSEPKVYYTYTPYILYSTIPVSNHKIRSVYVQIYRPFSYTVAALNGIGQ